MASRTRNEPVFVKRELHKTTRDEYDFKQKYM